MHARFYLLINVIIAYSVLCISRNCRSIGRGTIEASWFGKNKKPAFAWSATEHTPPLKCVTTYKNIRSANPTRKRACGCHNRTSVFSYFRWFELVGQIYALDCKSLRTYKVRSRLLQTSITRVVYVEYEFGPDTASWCGKFSITNPPIF